jgi:hypothetical protein
MKIAKGIKVTKIQFLGSLLFCFLVIQATFLFSSPQDSGAIKKQVL